MYIYPQSICQKVKKKNVSKIVFIAFIYLNCAKIVINVNKIFFSCFSSYYFRATLALSFTKKQISSNAYIQRPFATVGHVTANFYIFEL